MGLSTTIKALAFAFAVAASASTSASAASSDSLDPKDYAAQDVITRDVVIIGGGSSGVYTGVHLGDYNKSVVIVEEKDRLGGHAQTYIDPGTNIPINLGVVVFEPIQVVKDYFARFNIDLTKVDIGSTGGRSQYVNFATGEPITLPATNQSQQNTAFEKYAVQLSKYPGIATGFNLTYPVASDVLLPFGEFVAKYNLQSFMSTVFQVNQGYCPINNITTLYMLKYLNSNLVRAFQRTGLLTTQDTSALYVAITKYLGSNVLLSSTVVRMDRSTEPIKVLVNTPSGRKLIVAKKLVSAIPPKIDNLHGYDLSPMETFLFSKFFNNAYYTGLVNNTGISASQDFLDADPHLEYNAPKLPGLYGLPTVPGTNLTQVFYASPTTLPNEEVKSDILATIARVQKGVGIIPPKEPAEFVVFYSHAPFNLMVSKEEIKSGFYKNLTALQGQRNTFYNGAAFTSQDSSIIWTYTHETVLPALLNAL